MSEDWNPWVRDALRSHEKERGAGTSRVGRFVLSNIIGEGGMGVVWLARDPELSRDVALKVLRPPGPGGRALLERFHREAQNAAKLQHPNIVTVYEAGQDGETFFIAMEFIRGQPLSAWCQNRSRPLQAVLRLVELAARGVQAAHDRGIVHRDLKPGNIMVDAQAQPHIVDFGLSRAIETDHTVTRTGAVIGSPCYMSPEQVRGETRRVGPLSDVYALGVVLYEALSGRVPFEGDSVASVFEGILERDPPPLTGVPAPVAAICARAMEKEPARRYASAGEFADDLRRYLVGESVTARRMSTLRRLARATWRRRAIVFPALAAVAVAAVALVWAGRGAEDAGRREREAREGEAALKRREEAAKRADKLFEAGRTALDAAYRYLHGKRADDALLLEQVGKGRALVREGLDIDPERALGHYLLGWAAEMQGDVTAAEEGFRAAIARDAQFGPARWQLARLLVVRSFLASLGTTEEERKGRERESTRLVHEAETELRAAIETATGFDDEMLRALARGMLEYLHKEPAAAQTAQEGLARFASREGIEEFHFLQGLTLTGRAQIAAFTRAIEERPRHPLALLCRAIRRQDLGDLGGAIDDYTKSIEINPREAKAFIGRGTARKARKELAAARADFEEAGRLDPADGVPHFNLGVLAQDAGDMDGAIAAFDESIKRNPRETRSLANRALLRYHRREYEASLADYDRVVEIAPHAFDSWHNRGITRYRKGDRDGAFADFTKAIEVAPHRAAGYWSRSIVRKETGDPKVTEDYEKVVALEPGRMDAWRALGVAGAHEDLRSLVDDLSEAIRRDPKRTSAYVARGMLRINLRELDAAMQDLDEAVRLDPRRVPALHSRGIIHYLNARYALARDDCRRGVEIDPEDVGCTYYLGAAHAALNELEPAHAMLRRALELAPRDWRDRAMAEQLLANVAEELRK